MLKLEENAGLEFAGWYDNSEKIPKAVDKSTEIYNGAVLDAGWKTPQTLPDTVDKAFDELVAVGLPQDAKLVLDEVKDTDKKEHADLAKELIEINDKAAVGGDVYELVEGTPIVSVDINVENLESNAKGIVTVLLPTPEGLKDVKLDAGERIIAIHFAKDNNTYVIPVEVGADGNMSFELDLRQGFSPFFFVKVKTSEKKSEPSVIQNPVTVRVNGTEEGYIIARTLDDTGFIYLPLNEDVILEKGTEIVLSAVPHGNKSCVSYTIKDKDNHVVTEKYQSFYKMVIKNDCEITPVFTAANNKENDNEIHARLEPGVMGGKGVYKGKVVLEQWNASTQTYEIITDAALRIPTEEDWPNWDWDWTAWDWDFFNYDADNNVLTSKDELELNFYVLPFIVPNC